MPHAYLHPALRLSALCCLVAGVSPGLQGQKPGPKQASHTGKTVAKRPITHDVYATWKSLQGTTLSRDGQWMAYAMTPQEGDSTVVVRHLATGKIFQHSRGTAPLFSADGRFLAFTLNAPFAETEQAKREKKKPEEMPKAGLGVMNLSTGQVDTLERVKRWAMGEEGGNHLVALLEAPKKEGKKAEKPEPSKDEDADDQAPPMPGAPGGAGAGKKEAGTELVILEPGTPQRTSIQDVADFRISKQGGLLAYVVSVKGEEKPKDGEKPAQPKPEDKKPEDKKPEEKSDATEGVYLRILKEGSTRTLASGGGTYKHLAFDDAGKHLAFVTNRDDAKAKAPCFSVYHWTEGADTAAPLVTKATQGMPAGWAPSEHGALQFSKDGGRLFLGTAPTPKETPKDAPEPLKVDIWHWKDPELQPMQKAKAEAEKKRSYRAVVHLAQQTFVQLGRLELREVTVNDNPRFALALDDRQYQMAASWDAIHQDAYAVDLLTGEARKLAVKLRHGAQLSPGGRYIVAFDAYGSQWFAYETATGRMVNLTGKLKVPFEDREQDTPEPPRAYGMAGWTAEDARVVIYDQFDLWSLDPEGTDNRCLTDGFGRKHNMELRYTRLDPDEKVLPSEQPWLLTGTHDVTRSTEIYRQDPKGGAPVNLLHADKQLGGLLKAKKADTLLYTQQTFQEFPDLWATNLAFASPKKVTDANPQQSTYLWGSMERIEYTNSDGVKLKALLAKPEGFDPSKQYPMMVYIYEKMADGVHRYMAPSPGQNINVTRFVSNGYVVLMPDIIYEAGFPGRSAMKCVLPAVSQQVAKGYIDPKRIGIQGHSWGGYQITYLITQTNLFRAVEAGASVSNMTSAYGGIRWGTGMSRAWQYERSQSRIGANLWEAPFRYLENSPVFYADKVQTPYLTVHNDEDDAVPWYQAIEFFTALRRLGKEAYWFNYNGQLHGLRDKDAIKHFTVHMCEFFDHYLLNAPRPEWMDTPVPYLERGKRDVRDLFKPKPQP